MSGCINIFLLYDFMTLIETTLPFYQFQCARRIKKGLPRPQEANACQAMSALHVLVVMQQCCLEVSVRVFTRPVVTLASYRYEPG